MANQKTENDRELSRMVKVLVEGTTSELKDLIPKIDLSADIPDSKIKKAILDVSPQGMEKLFAQFGREQVMGFISEFSKGRRF